ncbi:Yip1 family protein [Paraglaciecola sp. L3A3]|uniref:Yip1 family protein n=1 Tax=Paraglaciecola sp. L3A3 TaxID=2686358 RepID=UPI00131ABCE7|nr:Yip1 family protein [Paraglaciecola sp. L3A3]
MDDRFKHLGPIEHPDETGIYMDVLSQCIGNPDIKNIAIAGPYAAGKSSVINKYLKHYLDTPEDNKKTNNLFTNWFNNKTKNKSHKVLTIAIATFQERQSPQGDVEDLQLQILQQILYTETGAELPRSRFNRIKNIKRSLLAPLLITIWSIISYFLFAHSSILTIYKPWSYEYFLVFLMVWINSVLTILGLEWFFHFLSSKTFSKISLKNLEFEKSKDDDTSILNKYFDEILYFFDRHPYELVIFEDLDRFKEPEIFTKLRELNTLLNQNRGIKRDIQFIYALKDSMFAVNDRTKFFDFILPVVPVTGTANSEDEFIARNQKLSTELTVDKNLLRDISQFITDPRTINNTFNEYVIYKTAINSPNLDSAQLFSLVLYKNIFVKDFDELHYGKGMLYDVLTHTEEYKLIIKQGIVSEIDDLEVKIANADYENSFSENELLNIYIAQLYRQGICSIFKNQSRQDLSDIKTIAKLKELIPKEDSQIAGVNFNNHRVHLVTSVKALEKELNPGTTIDARLIAAKNKTEGKLKQLREQSQKLRKKLKDIELSKLRELSEYDETIIKIIDEKFSEDGNSKDSPWQHVALVKYLVRKGLLNENYQLYSTVFNNKEHWTIKDQQLFLKIQSRQKSEYSFTLDNPAELVKRLTGSDFKSIYIFNVSILECILEHCPKNAKTSNFLQTIKEHYSEEGAKFLSSYLSVGNNLHTLSKQLLKEWPEYLEVVFNQSQSGTEAQWLINTIDKYYLDKLPSHELLLNILEEQPEIFIQEGDNQDSSNALELIIHFELNIPSLDALSHFPISYASIIEEARFKLSLNNMQLALAHYGLDTTSIQKQTYQQVLNTNNTKLRERIDSNIDTYVENVMFQNTENTEEPEAALLHLINNIKLSDKNREKVIDQQLHVFQSLENVNSGHDFIFEHRKILPSWQLLAEYYDSEMVNNNTFVDYVSDKNTIERLLKSNINEIKQNIDVFSDLQNFLLNSNDINDTAYSKIANVIIDNSLDQWPKISDEKMQILLDLKVVKLNSNTYENIADKPTLLAHLIVNNTSEYLKHNNELSSLDFKDISEILKLNPEYSLAVFIAELLPSFSLEEYNIDGDKLTETYLLLEPDNTNPKFIETLILHTSKNTNISDLFDRLLSLVPENEYTQIIVKLGHKLTKSKIKNALSKHPNEKLSDLTSSGKRPNLAVTEINRQLLEILKEQKILSDYTSENGVYPIRKSRDWL